jgi:hypothetical protein
MSKIHVLPDENLGGVLREYVEVDRIARVGDYVTKDGYVRKVSSRDTHFGNTVEFDEYYKGETGDDVCGWVDGYYKTPEPTDIVHIDGARYRLVDRKAKVGEKVIVVDAHLNGESYKNGDIFIVREVQHSVIFVIVDSVRYIALSHFEYKVLEPVEPAELVTAEEGDDKSVLDLLANLARRVTELERKFESLESRQKRLMGRIADTEEKIEMILDDIVALDERTQPLVNPSVITAIPTFKYSDLVGKTLKIYGGRNGDHVIVFGYDESTGKSYVLFSGKEGGEGR